MTFQINDLVVISPIQSEGRIIAILNDNLSLLRLSNGNEEIKVMNEFLESSDFDWTQESDKERIKKNKSRKQVPEGKKNAYLKKWGIYIGFFPKHFKNILSDDLIFNVCLLNNTKYSIESIQLSISERSHIVEKLNADQVLPFSVLELFDISLFTLKGLPNFNLIISNDKKIEIINTIFKPNPVQLLQEIENLNNRIVSYIDFCIFTEEDYEKRINHKVKELTNISKFPKTKTKPKVRHTPIEDVIDLHIERLMPNATHLKTGEILQIQLEAFEKYLSQIINSKFSSFTVIHGIGEGILKEAVHNILRTTPQVIQIIDGYMPKYGYGATQAILRK